MLIFATLSINCLASSVLPLVSNHLADSGVNLFRMYLSISVVKHKGNKRKCAYHIYIRETAYKAAVIDWVTLQSLIA